EGLRSQLLEVVLPVDVQPAGGGLHPREMVGEPKRPAPVDAQGLERRPAAEKRLVVRIEHWLLGRNESTTGDRDGEQGHRATGSGSGAPIASRSGRALTSDSSISASG